jgi:predicted transcriptional regulator
MRLEGLIKINILKQQKLIFYIAKETTEVVGRITAIINWSEVNDQR